VANEGWYRRAPHGTGSRLTRLLGADGAFGGLLKGNFVLDYCPVAPSVFLLTDTSALHPDCRHFRGDLPCRRPNKTDGYVCAGCPHAPVTQRVPSLPLQQSGDVV
jgi:hypothetical protein